MKELKDLSASDIGSLVRTRAVSPVEVVRYFLDRIKKAEKEKHLGAFTYLKEEEALNAASDLEKKMDSGYQPGRFAGVPFALKDFLPSKKGWTNTHGGVIGLEDFDKYSSAFCRAMEKADGIAIGKTNAPAFGFRGTCDNKWYGPTKNPYNPEYNSGGSSGGSAAAVAAGLVPIAEGGDAGGSIRIPAAWCGCYGFKASYGLIPCVTRPDAWAASHPYCVPGGLTKTVEDAENLHSLLVSYNSRDPLSVCMPSEKKHHSIAGLKVGVTLDFGGIFDSVDPEIEEAVQKAAKILESEKAVIEFIPNYLPLFADIYKSDYLAELWCRHISVDSMLEFEERKKTTGFDLIDHCRNQLPAEFISWYRKAEQLTVFDFYEFSKVRTRLLDTFHELFSHYDILLSPVTTCLPVRNSKDWGETKGPEGHERLIGFAETFLYNFTGNPAASCPAGFSKTGLPIGVQVAGDRFADNLVLEVSKFLESHKAEF